MIRRLTGNTAKFDKNREKRTIKLEKQRDKCLYCGKDLHKPIECHYFICDLCQKHGHTSKDCRINEKDVKFCVNCKAKTHEISKCIVIADYIDTKKSLEDVSCFICRRMGHINCSDI